MATEDKVYSIAMLIDDLKSDDSKKRYSFSSISSPSFRFNSIKNLPNIAKALGSERTRTELIPFLAGFTYLLNNNNNPNIELTDDEDENLLSLSEILGNFTELIGGPSHSLVLIKILENLSCAEETIVRDKAIESLKKVLGQARIKDKEADYIELIKRLINGQETFTSKIAGMSIIPVCYPFVSPPAQQDLIRYLFPLLDIVLIVSVSYLLKTIIHR